MAVSKELKRVQYICGTLVACCSTKDSASSHSLPLTNSLREEHSHPLHSLHTILTERETGREGGREGGRAPLEEEERVSQQSLSGGGRDLWRHKLRQTLQSSLTKVGLKDGVGNNQ